MLSKLETVRTTITFPAELINRSQHFIDGGLVPSRNALIVAAVEQYLADLERQEIDRQFETMSEDADYQALNQALTESFADSDWETFAKVEAQ